VIDVSGVSAAVEEMAQVLRADGGDLVLVEANPATDRIEVRLELEDVSCLDCVMPTGALHDVISASIARRSPGEFELVLVDPRA
jgi:Fe-S cluster biogenesis protein NfuA